MTVPLQTWGHSFNFSIWYVELCGVMEESRVKQAQSDFQQVSGFNVVPSNTLTSLLRQCLERRAVQLCLKHLRQRDYGEAFAALRKKAKVDLDHPLLSEMHSLLVEQGDFEATERMMKQAAEGQEWTRGGW